MFFRLILHEHSHACICMGTCSVHARAETSAGRRVPCITHDITHDIPHAHYKVRQSPSNGRQISCSGMFWMQEVSRVNARSFARKSRTTCSQPHKNFRPENFTALCERVSGELQRKSSRSYSRSSLPAGCRLCIQSRLSQLPSHNLLMAVVCASCMRCTPHRVQPSVTCSYAALLGHASSPQIAPPP